MRGVPMPTTQLLMLHRLIGCAAGYWWMRYCIWWTNHWGLNRSFLNIFSLLLLCWCIYRVVCSFWRALSFFSCLRVIGFGSGVVTQDVRWWMDHKVLPNQMAFPFHLLPQKLISNYFSPYKNYFCKMCGVRSSVFFFAKKDHGLMDELTWCICLIINGWHGGGSIIPYRSHNLLAQ